MYLKILVGKIKTGQHRMVLRLGKIKIGQIFCVLQYERHIRYKYEQIDYADTDFLKS